MAPSSKGAVAGGDGGDGGEPCLLWGSQAGQAAVPGEQEDMAGLPGAPPS